MTPRLKPWSPLQSAKPPKVLFQRFLCCVFRFFLAPKSPLVLGYERTWDDLPTPIPAHPLVKAAHSPNFAERPLQVPPRDSKATPEDLRSPRQPAQWAGIHIKNQSMTCQPTVFRLCSSELLTVRQARMRHPLFGIPEWIPYSSQWHWCPSWKRWHQKDPTEGSSTHYISPDSRPLLEPKVARQCNIARGGCRDPRNCIVVFVQSCHLCLVPILRANQKPSLFNGPMGFKVW